MIDWRGTDYDVGSTVLYARQVGRSVELQEGTVLEFVPNNDYDASHHGDVKVRIEPTRNSRFGFHPEKPVLIKVLKNITALP